jgi:hypothetical protein
MSEENKEKGTEQDKVENVAKLDLKKWLYAFEATINGVTKKMYIAKPTRSLRQLGDIEYAKQLAFFVKAGLLPKAAWSTILDNLGGTVSNSEAEGYSDSRRKYFELSIELSQIKEEDRTEEEKVRANEIETQLSELRDTMQSFELEQAYIFENTAEAKARDNTIQWWLCQLSHEGEKAKFFQGKNSEEMLDWYDALDITDEKEKELFNIGRRFNYLITMWFLGRIASHDDFEAVDKSSSFWPKDKEVVKVDEETAATEDGKVIESVD